MATEPVSYERLKLLAASRPAEARASIEGLLDTRPPSLPALLDRMSAPGEGRLRQLVANAVRVRPERASAVPRLQQWFDVETDEFTKRALRGALDALEVRAQVPPSSRKRGPTPVAAHVVEAFRFASGRISHRLRNALNGPQATLGRIRAAVDRLDDPVVREQISALAAQLASGFNLVGRVAEFDVSDEHFRFRTVVLADWLRSMNTEYASRYEAVELGVEEAPGRPASVHANKHYLETIFWNLWTNAQQAVEGVCRINVKIEQDSEHVHVTIRDNGDGIPAEVAAVAFEQPFSTKASTGRGQGLLEIQDAVEQLRGEATLVEATKPGRFWIKLTFPLGSV